jgi:hypothetical protein
LVIFVYQNQYKMEIKVLTKYTRSRLRGSLIRDLSVYLNGKVIVNAENGDKKEFWIEYSAIDYSGDAILCEFQDDVDINVSKY